MADHYIFCFYLYFAQFFSSPLRPVRRVKGSATLQTAGVPVKVGRGAILEVRAEWLKKVDMLCFCRFLMTGLIHYLCCMRGRG